MPAGMARIEVRFLIDANGILSVTARDLRTGHGTERRGEALLRPHRRAGGGHDPGVVSRRPKRTSRQRQVREARVEADTILLAVDKAKANDAWDAISDDERAAVDRALNQLLMVYHGDDHLLIRAEIEKLDAATRKLAENMMNTAVRGALKGTKIE